MDPHIQFEVCSYFENTGSKLVAFEPFAYEPGVKQMPKQCGANEYGVHIRTGATLLSQQILANTNSSSARFDCRSYEMPDSFQITCVDDRYRCFRIEHSYPLLNRFGPRRRRSDRITFVSTERISP